MRRLLSFGVVWCFMMLVSAPAALAGGFGFGLQSAEVTLVNRDGTPDVQAGSHPYALVTQFVLNESEALTKEAEPDYVPAAGGPKVVRVELPRGLMGNANATPKCTYSEFAEFSVKGCPADTAVGEATTGIASHIGHIDEATGKYVDNVYLGSSPVYNLQPPAGVVAEFGYHFAGAPVILDSSLRTGGDYGLTSTTHVPQAAVVQEAKVKIWGVPGDPSHNAIRGKCLAEAPSTGEEEHNEEESKCEASGSLPVRPLLTVSTSCGEATSSLVSVDSWDEPGTFFSKGTAMPEVTGCEHLSFTPSLGVSPDVQSGGTPSGLSVDVGIPAPESPEGLAEANLHKAVVTLPQGMVINPSAANGLGACSAEQFGLHNANPVVCPQVSKVGVAEALSPALNKPLEGSVYVAQQSQNPFGSLLALYVVLEGEGVLVKQAGEVRLDPATGQIVTTFSEVPQQPTSEIKLHLFGGPRAALVTPPGCGSYTATSQLTPYSSLTPAEPFSAFSISTAANASGCGTQGFAPAFSAGTTGNQAGAFSPFSVSFSRQDQEQDLAGVTLTTPPGLLGMLSRVSLCGEPQAAQGACPAGSLIGHTTVAAGAGPDPVYVAGQVFLTGPYGGGPFGLSIVVPAVAGPFNLGDVVVRAAIHVDPRTAQITVVSDPLPTILQGVPLQLKMVNVSIDREGFMFNPTDCEPLSVTGTLTSTQGATANVSSHFQAANCAALPFHPVFSVSTQAKTSKQSGASLTVKGAFTAGNANIHSVAVVLPKQLPARLTTIQQACPEATFNANPASCPTGSNIGTATASTPVLANPVTGPVYLVSHGGAAFPDVVAILQGEGVTIDLTGSIDIKKGVTSSTFASVPDAPIGSFQLTLPEGPHSGLAAVVPASAKGSLCGQSLAMPFTITGQNGAVLAQNVKIQVTGCPKAKEKTHKAKPKHTRKGKRGKK